MCASAARKQCRRQCACPDKRSALPFPHGLGLGRVDCMSRARAHMDTHTIARSCVCVCACVCVCVCVCVSQPAQVYLATESLREAGSLGADMVNGEDAVQAVRDVELGSWQSAAAGASVSSAMPPLQVPTPTDPRFNPRLTLRGRVSAGGSDFTFMCAGVHVRSAPKQL